MFAAANYTYCADFLLMANAILHSSFSSMQKVALGIFFAVSSAMGFVINSAQFPAFLWIENGVIVLGSCPKMFSSS
jgi:hypothetical protein